jgi:hypothetical protein
MRRYDIASGILLILSIIDFALAAPVLVQEKRQACADVVHIAKDVIPVLGKRGDPLEELWDKYFQRLSGKPIGSSDAHAPASSAPPGPDQGSTNAVQAPAPDQGSTNVAQAPVPNQASSTADLEPLMEPLTPPSTPSSHGVWGVSEYAGSDDDRGLQFTPSVSEHGSDHELTGTHAPEPNPNPDPTGADSEPFDWEYWMNLHDPAPPKEIGGQDPENQVGHMHQPNPSPPSTGAGPDPNFDWDYWMNMDDPAPDHGVTPPSTGVKVYHVEADTPPPSPFLGSPKGPEHEVVTPPSTGAGLPPALDLDHGSEETTTPLMKQVWLPKEPAAAAPEDEVPPGPPPTPESADPSDHQSLSADSQPVDLPAAIYAAKGKAKSLASDPEEVSFFLVPHSSAYPQTYILIDIF